MSNSTQNRRRTASATQSADSAEALLKQLEFLVGDIVTGDESIPPVIDHRMRMLFAKCAQRLQAVQTDVDLMTIDAQKKNERAKALFAQADSLNTEIKTRLEQAQNTRRNTEVIASDLVTRAEDNALDALDSAIELADSYIGHHEIGAHTVENWISKKAGNLATTIITDLESQIVEVGSIRDDIAPQLKIVKLDAA